jgi:diaminopimelate epimerase
MRFTKMHGAGNDYIYVNCFEEEVPNFPDELAVKVSDRRFGIGGDGLILIMPSKVADARMWMFNADGSQAEMCGNGIRCVAKYVYDHGICRREELNIETGAGVLHVRVDVKSGKVDQVTVDMGEPILSANRIPTTLAEGEVLHQPLNIDGHALHATCVSMGNPHCVIFVPEATDELVLGIGPKIEMDSRFPKRTNVEFVEILSRNEVRQRTWERGSGETWACGTGASAVCVAGVLTGNTDRQIVNHLRGGDLLLHWDATTNHVMMTGPAKEVFSGDWES